MRERLDSKNSKNMADAQLLRLLLAKITYADILELLEPSAHLRLLLVRGLQSDTDELYLTSVFLPFDEAPVVAIERSNHAGIVLLQHRDGAEVALRDPEGWFSSLGLQLIPVCAGLLGESLGVIGATIVETSTTASEDRAVKRPDAPPGFTGAVVDNVEWDELWDETTDTVTAGRDLKCNHSTALQNATVHDCLGGVHEQSADDMIVERVSHDINQMLFSLPRKYREKIIFDVVTAMGSGFLADLEKQQQSSVQDMNHLESQDFSVDIASISQHVQDTSNNPNERRQQSAEGQWGMWRSLLCSVTASALSHIVLYVLVRNLDQGGKKDLENKKIFEEKENKKITTKDRMSWFWEKIVAPVCMGLVMCLLRVYVIGTEEKRIAPQYTNNAVANLAINSASKIAYFAIKEFPTLVTDLYIWAHVVSFFIDLVGAIFLWWRRGYHDPDVPDS